MPNKIGSSDSSPVHVGTGQTVSRNVDSSSSAKSAPAAGSGSADARITDSARSLASLESALRDLPAVDNARVESVSGKIASGSYKVNSERVANKLLQSERELAPFK